MQWRVGGEKMEHLRNFQVGDMDVSQDIENELNEYYNIFKIIYDGR